MIFKFEFLSQLINRLRHHQILTTGRMPWMATLRNGAHA